MPSVCEIEGAKGFGRTHHMLMSVWGRRWREVLLANFTLFFDDSGTSPSQHVAVAAALIVPAAQLLRLESEWTTMRNKHEFEEWHTSESVANWPEDKTARVFSRVRQISKKYGTVAVSCTINKNVYNETVPPELKKYTGEHHYSWCLTHVLAMIELWRMEHHKDNPFEIIFDWMGPSSDEKRKEVEKTMDYLDRAAVEDGRPGIFENRSFRHRREIPGLQCVDPVAWTTYQYALWKMHKVPLHQQAEISWKEFGGELGQSGWLKAFTFERAALAEWVRKELADGTDIERFKRWDEERAKKASSDRSRS